MTSSTVEAVGKQSWQSGRAGLVVKQELSRLDDVVDWSHLCGRSKSTILWPVGVIEPGK
jgi:hypothetical protein